MNTAKEYTIFNAATPIAITSSTDATPIQITATSHGLATDDLVLIYGHATNVAANGIYRVTRVNANAYTLKDLNSGTSIAGTGAGAGSGGLMVAAPKILSVNDFKNVVLSISTGSSATLTLKVAGSIGKVNGDTPNFGATVSASNPYSFVEIINLDTGGDTNGSTGVIVSGTDIANLYEVNTNLLKYISVIPTSWSQGSITVKAIVNTDN